MDSNFFSAKATSAMRNFFPESEGGIRFSCSPKVDFALDCPIF